MDILSHAKTRFDGIASEYHPGDGFPNSRRGRVGDYAGRNHGTQYGVPMLLFVSGTSDYVSVDQPAITQFPFSIAGRFRTIDTSGFFFWCGDKDVANDWLGIFGSGNDIRVLLRDDDFNPDDFSAAAYHDGELHDMVVTAFVDGAAVKITAWLDGVNLGTLTSAAATTFWADIASDRTAIGRAMDSTPSDTINGNLGDWHAYDNVRASDVSAMRFHNGSDFHETATLIWRCNESSGSLVVDYAGSSYTGVISSATHDFGANGGNSHWRNTDALDMVGDATDADTTLAVDDGSKFSAGDYVGANGTGEVFQVGTPNGDDLEDCTRGALGTTAAIITDNTILRIVGDQQTASGLYLPGSANDEYVDIPGAAVNRDEGTLIFWLNSPDIGSSETVFNGETAGNVNEWVVFFDSNKKVNFVYRKDAGDTRQIVAVGASEEKTDIFIACTYHDVDGVELYVDDAVAVTGATNFTLTGVPTTFKLGTKDSPALPLPAFFKRVDTYRRVLSALEIAAIREKGPDG